MLNIKYLHNKNNYVKFIIELVKRVGRLNFILHSRSIYLNKNYFLSSTS